MFHSASCQARAAYRLLLALGGAVALLGFGAAAAGAAVSCTVNPTTAMAAVTVTGVETVTISRTAAGVIKVNSLDCGTVTTVDRIAVSGDVAGQTLLLNLGAGGFAPGKTPEPTGLPEIEFSLVLGGGGNSLTLVGSTTAADTLTLGSGGIGLNGDVDADATYSGVRTLRVNGNLGNDVVSGAGSPATGEPYGRAVTIDGGDGNDVLTGGRAFDLIVGGGQDDVLNGASGADRLDGQAGNDVLNGNEGADTLTTGPGNDTYNAGTGHDTIGSHSDASVADGADVFSGGPGSDNAYTFRARIAPVRISLDGVANDGADADQDGTADEADNVNTDVEGIQLGKADDTFTASPAAGFLNRALSGNEGNDTITGSRVADAVDGGLGNDTISTLAGNDTLTGLGGNDVLNGGDDNDTVSGGDGNDSLTGGNDDDSLHGGNHDDVLRGGAGNDTVNGDLGRDQEFGDAGDDRSFAPSVNDGTDLIDGGTGYDSLFLSSRAANQRITLDNLANDGLAGESDNVRATWELIQTGAGNDLISADAAPALDNILQGGLGNDELAGGRGMDQLEGSAGNDLIRGGAGEDLVYGSTGSDTIDALDFEYDYVDAGPDIDSVRYDAGIDDVFGLP